MNIQIEVDRELEIEIRDLKKRFKHMNFKLSLPKELRPYIDKEWLYVEHTFRRV